MGEKKGRGLHFNVLMLTHTGGRDQAVTVERRPGASWEIPQKKRRSSTLERGDELLGVRFMRVWLVIPVL